MNKWRSLFRCIIGAQTVIGAEWIRAADTFYRTARIGQRQTKRIRLAGNVALDQVWRECWPRRREMVKGARGHNFHFGHEKGTRVAGFLTVKNKHNRRVYCVIYIRPLYIITFRSVQCWATRIFSSMNRTKIFMISLKPTRRQSFRHRMFRRLCWPNLFRVSAFNGIECFCDSWTTL